jgi:hypothetical protein
MASKIRQPRRIQIALLLTITACKGSDMPSSEMAARENPVITRETWQSLASKKIFFGHQSVGAEIIDGIKTLAAQSGGELKIVKSQVPTSVQGPAFVESAIGENGDPRSKTRAFAQIMKSGFGEEGGIALFKFCFLDVDPGTDPDALFREYRATISEVQQAYPRLQIVHVTLPLTRAENPPLALVKTILKRPSQRDLDARRHRFNELLRKEYTGSAPIFDLARIESTRADGTRSSFQRAGETVYSLAPEWTYDGGHLNEAGRKVAATELVQLLAQVKHDTGDN